MDADTFVEKLWNCAPPIDSLIHVGLGAMAAEEFQLRNRADLRQRSAEPHNNPLIDLVSRYDVSRLEIGIVRFYDGVQRLDGSWQVGKAEADPLVISKFSGEVEVRDLTDETAMLWRCAVNGAFFLEAMLHAGCFLSRASYDLALSDDQSARCAQAIACARVAGGEPYRAFYNVLLGCDD
jgi:hypothetical protein